MPKAIHKYRIGSLPCFIMFCKYTFLPFFPWSGMNLNYINLKVASSPYDIWRRVYSAALTLHTTAFTQLQLSWCLSPCPIFLPLQQQQCWHRLMQQMVHTSAQALSPPTRSSENLPLLWSCLRRLLDQAEIFLSGSVWEHQTVIWFNRLPIIGNPATGLFLPIHFSRLEVRTISPNEEPISIGLTEWMQPTRRCLLKGSRLLLYLPIKWPCTVR